MKATVPPMTRPSGQGDDAGPPITADRDPVMRG